LQFGKRNEATRVFMAAEGALSNPVFARSKYADNWRRQRDMARTIILLRQRLGDADDAR
jgi:hypothetical protein